MLTPLWNGFSFLLQFGTAAKGGLKIAALTNNIQPPTSVPEGQGLGSLKDELEHLALGKGYASLKNEFDMFIESSVVGMRWVILGKSSNEMSILWLTICYCSLFKSSLDVRKPDPKFYQYALDKLGVKGEEVVFLDDIGMWVVRVMRTRRSLPKKTTTGKKNFHSQSGFLFHHLFLLCLPSNLKAAEKLGIRTIRKSKLLNFAYSSNPWLIFTSRRFSL